MGKSDMSRTVNGLNSEKFLSTPKISKSKFFSVSSEVRSKIVVEEVLKFRELVKGHRKLLEAIGRL